MSFGQQPNKDGKPAFSFGQPTTPATTGTFGASGATNTFGASAFGSTPAAGGAKPPTGGIPFGFGQQPAATGTATGGFGSGTATFGSQPAATSGFSFGAKPVQAAATAQPASTTVAASGSGTSTFGSGSGFGAQAQPSTTQAKPTSFSFGAPATSASGSTSTALTAAAPTTSFNFGAKPSETPSFSFGTPATPAAKPQANQAPATQGPLSLSALKTPTGANVPATPTPATFGTSATTGTTATVKSNTGTATTATSGFNFGAKTEPLKDAPKEKEKEKEKEVEVLTSLKGKNLAEILSDWQSDLHQTTNAFHTKASEIAQLDNQLLELSDLVYRLVVESTSLTTKQNELVQVLDFVEGQQSALDRELDKFEEKLTAMVKEGVGASATDVTSNEAPEQSRERTYELAEQLSREGSALNEKLNQLASVVNKQQGNNSSDDAMSLITKILNEHYNSLVWIDSTATALGKKLNMAKRYTDVAQTDLKHAQMRLK